MQAIIPAVVLIETVRARLADVRFWARHRTTPRAFTRQRKLPFDRVVLLLLPKTLKSLQLHLHAFFARLAPGAAATPGAWTQARLSVLYDGLNRLGLDAPPGRLCHR